MHLRVTHPPEICVNLVFKHIYVDRVLFDKQSTQIFINFTLCPPVLLSFLSEKKIFLSIFSYPF